jgi:hypothetical protein
LAFDSVAIDVAAATPPARVHPHEPDQPRALHLAALIPPRRVAMFAAIAIGFASLGAAGAWLLRTATTGSRAPVVDAATPQARADESAQASNQASAPSQTSRTQSPASGAARSSARPSNTGASARSVPQGRIRPSESNASAPPRARSDATATPNADANSPSSAATSLKSVAPAAVDAPPPPASLAAPTTSVLASPVATTAGPRDATSAAGPVVPPASPNASRAPAAPNSGPIYRLGDRGVSEPVLVKPYLPLKPRTDIPETALGVLELLVDTNGRVESVHLRSPHNRYREKWWLFSAKEWQFTPAMREGKPVRYLKRILLTDLNLAEPQ